MKRAPEVIDVWFDSGAMPFGQQSWPQIRNAKCEMRNSAKPELFPADFICEAQDQTRGWFYTLLAVSTLLGFGPPYLNVIVTGLLLDEKGEKMSKSKGNIVNPWHMLEKYGADAVRWYFLTVNQPSDPKLFSEKDIKDRLNKFVMTLWNSYAFWAMYRPKRISNFEFRISNLALLDRWILSRLHRLIKETTGDFDNFDFTVGCRKIENFVIEDLSKWYIRRSRPRFQKPKNKKELRQASQVLGYVLTETCKLTAPFAPFLSEKIYQAINSKFEISPPEAFWQRNSKIQDGISVHLADWPKAKTRFIKPKIESQMDWVRDIVAKALNLRLKAGIKVRQPLNKLKIKNEKLKIEPAIMELIKDEVNVKEVEFSKDLKEEVELDTKITPELKAEGFLRELVRQIQELRKEKGLSPGDKIYLELKLNPKDKKMLHGKIKDLQKEVKAPKVILSNSSTLKIEIKKQ